LRSKPEWGSISVDTHVRHLLAHSATNLVI
jgi:hypothetical protein